ncbi:uncharacterized protein N7483_012903 [Penicillium malachiteum]|uniref:uncharacterized protein n=1 Tax=Penicillium malachiteum TaxID=1324776 RepID=UPI0025465EE8|nr:uncharacterized protein N7483_012903 [Penicillium malachiteum]KAJ5715722.1 hypothetical protein N7483_012903 [Penicillium malachiteum]
MDRIAKRTDPVEELPPLCNSTYGPYNFHGVSSEPLFTSQQSATSTEVSGGGHARAHWVPGLK